MRHVNKKLAVMTAAMAMASLASMTAFAATSGWVQEGNTWYYIDSNGDRVTDTWKTSGSHKYYLGDDGKMVTDDIVEGSGSGYYYVNADGAMITNEWRLVDDGEGEERWMYFSESGKSYESGWKTIGNYKYHFTDNKMNYGFLDDDGSEIEDDDGREWETAVYYTGDNAHGQRLENQWLEVFDFDSDKYEDVSSIWIYFDSNGKKVTNKTKTINGVKYAFDDLGAMVTEWLDADTATSSNIKYYSEDGAQYKGRWFQAVPSEAQNYEDYHDGTERWFYANSNGNLVKDTMKTINSKKYIFDDAGIMQTGLIVVDDSNKIVEVLGNLDDEMPTASEVKAAYSSGKLMYFAESGERKTGKISVRLDDDTYTMKFKSSGQAVHGVEDGYLYDNGILLKAEDTKYEVVTWDGKEYLVNTSGKVQKSGEYKDTKEYIKYTVSGDNANGYTITQEYYK